MTRFLFFVQVTDYILSSIGHRHVIKVPPNANSLVGSRTCRDLTSGGGTFVIISELMSEHAPVYAHVRHHITAPYSKDVYVGGADAKHANRTLNQRLAILLGSGFQSKVLKAHV